MSTTTQKIDVLKPELEELLIQEKLPSEVRVRYAPSPTGFLHIGSVRTALFNYLFAKKCQGTFILRIEDTDRERSRPEFENDIQESLKWLGIIWDEGPLITERQEKGERQNYLGNYGPYRQSERLDIYEKYLRKLLEENKAYFCFCSEEELKIQRQYQLSRGEAPRYSGKCRDLVKKEVEKNLTEGKDSVIRFKTPSKKIVFNDLIKGKIEFDTGLIGDIIIAKSLSSPLFILAVVIDDFEMKITHIIRGEDHLSNTPKQILLQQALGFPQPEYSHLPLILGEDRSKLSKRYGEIAIREFRKLGYLPEALINFVAFLGWNPGEEREIYSLSSLIKEFSLERVQKSGAVFNPKRLDWINGFYIRQKSLEKLTELCLPYFIEAKFLQELKNNNSEDQDPPSSEELKLFETSQIKYKIIETGEIVDFDKIKKIIALYQERLKKLSEIIELTDFFFKDKLEYEKELLRWKDAGDRDIILALGALEKILSKIEGEDFKKEILEKNLLPAAEKFADELEKIGDRGYLLWPLRVALTGKEASAGLFEIAEILGKEKTLKRIKEALVK